MAQVMMAAPAAVITCYQCRNQMAMPPGVFQAYCPTCGAANQLAANPGVPQAVPVAVAPQPQVMTDVLEMLAPQKGVLMRQKLDILEALVGYEWRNKYKVATLPAGKGGTPGEWTDEAFTDQLSKGHLLTLKEESDCFERQCCRPRHSFKIKIKGGDDSKAEGQALGEFERPFQCTILCCCTLFFPQVLTARANGKETGKVIQHWPFMNNLFCCHRYWRVVDGAGKDVYMIRDDFCCNENMCAPSMCCPVRNIDILTPDMNTKVGSIIDIWPGCNARSFLGSADNYILNFPESATPTDKFNLLGALILIEYMVFEKKPNRNNNGGADLALSLA